MSKHVEGVVNCDEFKKIAKPFTRVQIEIFNDVSNGVHKDGLEKVKQNHDRVCNVQLPRQIFVFSGCLYYLHMKIHAQEVNHYSNNHQSNYNRIYFFIF